MDGAECEVEVLCPEKVYYTLSGFEQVDFKQAFYLLITRS